MDNKIADIKILIDARKEWFTKNLEVVINKDFLLEALNTWTEEDWIDYIIKTDSDIYEFSKDKKTFKLK